MEALGSCEMMLHVYQNTLHHVADDPKNPQTREFQISVYHYLLSQKAMPILCDLDGYFPKSKTVSFSLEKVDAIKATSQSRAPDIHDFLRFPWQPAERKLRGTV